jgi:hypothetical protein
VPGAEGSERRLKGSLRLELERGPKVKRQ